MEKHYWRYQLIGWLTLLGFDFASKALNGLWQYELLMAVFILYSFGFATSHGLRAIYKKYFSRLAIWLALPAALITCLLAGIIACAAMMGALYLIGHSVYSRADINPLEIFYYNLFLMWLFLLIWTGLYLFITRQRQVDDLHMEQQALKENLQLSQLNTLLNQLNPHFMFNCINNIRALILEDPNKARDMLAHMADMLRYNLQERDSSTETIEKELAVAHAFMQLASIQMEKRLHFNQDIDQNIDQQQQVPTMFIQLLLENAVKHGIAKLAGGGTVHLSLKYTGSSIHIQVSNDGTLIEQNANGIGLKNIRTRLAMLYGDSANFSIKQVDNPQTGSQVIALVNLPANHALNQQ
ncbi:histidine kinase [Catenovulum sp. 2E275]|uniref:sensor histidine kinase n=1 Tax=Catenovulum sp. 2E275 TaxID=2980497 RepID=UPI0021D23B36|nr:histidine kinase [Catenovulum sp. 2E275]MCU4674086.1 histidine kinase [Catenovulum sp. 2E275]